MDHKYKRVNPCAVVNTDKSALEAYKKRKKKALEMETRIELLENKLDKILELLEKGQGKSS